MAFKLTSKEVDFSKWYEQVIAESNLASHGLVKGTFIMHPKATYLWEQIQAFINREFKKNHVLNMMLSSLMPTIELEKEKKELTGFIPEIFLVRKSTDPDSENVFLRPTSEILFSHYFKNQINSYEDLPILANQWCNVYRAEKNTKLFLRTSEFYWQELHTVHLTKENALYYLDFVHGVYADLINSLLCISCLVGEKTINERFKGAVNTLTIEAIMTDGQVLQMATSHDLDKNFSKIFGITYRTKDNTLDNPYQLSAGCSTRLIGAIIMSHSDDTGLILPWDLAYIKVKILVINNAIQKDDSLVADISKQFGDMEFEWVFSSDSFGSNMTKSDLQGTPLVIVIGPKEVSSGQVMLKTRVKSDKKYVNFSSIGTEVIKAKEEYNQILRERNKQHLERSIVEVDNLKDAIDAFSNKKVVLAPWFDDSENETALKDSKHVFTPRCIKRRIESNENVACFFSGKNANCFAYFGRSY